MDPTTPAPAPAPDLAVPARASMSVASILEQSAHRHAGSVALVVGEERVTYRELWEQTRAYAGALAARGVGPGIPVAMMVPNVVDFPRVYYAVLALGGIVVPIHVLLKAEEVEHGLADSRARLLVCAAPLLAHGRRAADALGVPVVSVLAPDDHPDAPPRLEDAARAAIPIESYVPRLGEDIATVLYTSGTTGTPKGAASSHLAILTHIHALLLDAVDIRPEDRILGCLPLFHTFGQTGTMNAAFRVGATTTLMPAFDGDTALRLTVEHGTTVFMGVPSLFHVLLAAAKRSPSRPPLRYAVSGGAALPPAVLDAFREEFGADVHEGYGLTETNAVVSFNRTGVPPRPGTVGTPIWGVHVQIVDPRARDRIVVLPRGEVGEIVTRGHNMMSGYLHRPEDTARAITDGWFRTGDLGTMDDDGWIRILDRLGDMIIRNASNVYPREIEDVLSRHPAVAQCAVFGVPHPAHGQEIVAAVVAAPGIEVDPGAVLAFVRGRIAAYEMPRRLEVVDALPVGPSGKVVKRELTARFS